MPGPWSGLGHDESRCEAVSALRGDNLSSGPSSSTTVDEWQWATMQPAPIHISSTSISCHRTPGTYTSCRTSPAGVTTVSGSMFGAIPLPQIGHSPQPPGVHQPRAHGLSSTVVVRMRQDDSLFAIADACVRHGRADGTIPAVSVSGCQRLSGCGCENSMGRSSATILGIC